MISHLCELGSVSVDFRDSKIGTSKLFIDVDRVSARALTKYRTSSRAFKLVSVGIDQTSSTSRALNQ